MPAEAKKWLAKCGDNHIRSIEEYRYAADTTMVSLINIETGKTDFVHKTKIKEFWDNLADDDRTEMKSWSYDDFLERLNKACCYYLKRDNKVIATGGTYLSDLNICLWLLVTDKAYKYPKSLIKAVRKGIMKELSIYPDCMSFVFALPDEVSETHNRFIERVLKMDFMGYNDIHRVYMKDKSELLQCIGF